MLEQYDNKPLELRRCQEIELDLLLAFSNACKQLELGYFLVAGTLLGAVRHSGFIPWDDDIDVAMYRRDYELFIKNGQMCLPRGYFLQEYRTDPNFPCYHAKIRLEETRIEEPSLRSVKMCHGFFIDIFPLDICPDNPNVAIWFFKGIELLDCAILARVSSEFVCGYRKKYMRFLWKALGYLPTSALQRLREVFREIMAIGASGDILCTVGGGGGYPRECYQLEWLREVVYLEFEHLKFPCPAKWSCVLCNMYGNYLELPKPSDRKSHFDLS